MENTFNEIEFASLKKRYGKDAKEENIKLNINEKFFNEMKENIKKDRRGEVAFAVERPNGKVVVVRTSFYPENIFRLPTGGINYGEDIIEALYREVKEELGLEINIHKFLGVIKYTLKNNEDHIRFYSYVFWVKEKGGNILEDALEDEVSKYMEVNNEELQRVVDTLKNFNGQWKDWCMFRAITTEHILSR